MKSIAFLLSIVLFLATQGNAFQVAPNSNVAARMTEVAQKVNAKVTVPAFIALTAANPAWAAKAEEVAASGPPAYVGQEMAAAYLPAIMVRHVPRFLFFLLRCTYRLTPSWLDQVPLVGLVFPALSMALFFLYAESGDLDA